MRKPKPQPSALPLNAACPRWQWAIPIGMTACHDSSRVTPSCHASSQQASTRTLEMRGGCKPQHSPHKRCWELLFPGQNQNHKLVLTAKVRATKMELWKRGITLGSCLNAISDGSVSVLADWEPQEIPPATSISPPREKANSTCRLCWHRCRKAGPKEEKIDMVEGQAHQSLPVTWCLFRPGIRRAPQDLWKNH